MNFQGKRFIALFLVAVLLIPVFAMSASAAELTELVDVLQYGGINGTSDLIFLVEPSAVANFTIPKIPVFYVDVLIQATGRFSNLTAKLRDTSLTVLEIDSTHYRLYGDIGGLQFTNLNFTLSVTGFAYVTFLSVKVAPSRMSSYSLPATYVVNSSNGDRVTGNFNGSSTVLFNIDNKSEYPASVSLTLNISSSSWKLYDSLRLFMTTGSQSSFDGLNAIIGNISLPVSHSFISNGGNDNESYWVEVVVDLTNINRSLTDDLVIVIYYSQPALTNRRGALYTLNGYIGYDSVDPMFFYFRNVISSVEQGFGDVSSWITGQTNTLVSALQSIFQKDTTDSDQFQNDISQKGDQLGNISGALDSVNKPDIDNLNPDLSDVVSSAAIGMSASFLTIPLQNDIILKIFFMALTLALVAYVLYGKR